MAKTRVNKKKSYAFYTAVRVTGAQKPRHFKKMVIPRSICRMPASALLQCNKSTVQYLDLDVMYMYTSMRLALQEELHFFLISFS